MLQLPHSSKENRGEPGDSGLCDGEDDVEVMADMTEDMEGRRENLTQRSVMLAAFVFVTTCFVLVLFLLLLFFVCLLFLFSGWAWVGGQGCYFFFFFFFETWQATSINL